LFIAPFTGGRENHREDRGGHGAGCRDACRDRNAHSAAKPWWSRDPHADAGLYVAHQRAPDTLSYPISSEPSALTPQGAIDDSSALIAQQLYEGLFNLRADGSTVPAGAVGYKTSDDGKVYTVTLRAEAKWSDGKPVTAQHFVDGICRALEPATGNNYYYLLTDIARITGAKAFASGNTADCKKVGVKAVDDRTLQFSLEQPASFFPKLLSTQIFFPTRVDISRTVAGGLVNNGPYTLAESVPGEHLALRANPSYWNASQVGPKRIEFKVVPELADQFSQYKQGDLMVAEFPSENTVQVSSDPTFAKELRVLVRPGVSYLGLNTQAGATKSVALRKAIASAIDRKKLIEEVLKQRWHVPAQSAVPPDIPAHSPKTRALGSRTTPRLLRNSWQKPATALTSRSRPSTCGSTGRATTNRSSGRWQINSRRPASRCVSTRAGGRCIAARWRHAAPSSSVLMRLSRRPSATMASTAWAG